MEINCIYITSEYNKKSYAWYDFEADCDDWYMDSCHLWDENHFHILFNESTSPSGEHILERRQESSVHTFIQFSYSPMDEFLANSTYLDPHDQCQYLEHNFQPTIEFRYLQRGVHMRIWTWDPTLQWRLVYFNMVDNTSTWDLGSLAYFNIMVHTYP
jgi:hypothetical protein